MTRIDLVTELAHESEYAEVSGEEPTIPRVIAYNTPEDGPRTVADIFQKGESLDLRSFCAFIDEAAHALGSHVTVNGTCPDTLTVGEAVEASFA